MLAIYDLTYAERMADAGAVAEAWDHCHVVVSLQGLVNRKGPRLFIRAVRSPEAGDFNLDDWWLDRLRKPGGWMAGKTFEPIPNLEALIRRYRAEVRGLVVYDANVPATSNVASTIAGVENLLPVRWSDDPKSLLHLLRGMGLPVKRWLVKPDGAPVFTGKGTIPDTGEPSSGSAKNDAYRWACARYLENGRCAPDVLGFYIDAAWLRDPKRSGFWNHTLTNHDYFISRRAFFFDLSPWDDEAPADDPGQPPGADLATLRRILAATANRNAGKRMTHVGGFIPWAWKYSELAGSKHEGVPSEWEFVRVISGYNAYLDADALGIGAMANASFFRHQKLPKYPPERETVAKARGPVPDLDRGKHYVTFYVGDWDSAAWLYQMLPTRWEDPKRGSLPLGWAFNPNLAERFPAGFAYTRETRSPNDCFVAGDTGAGYINPSLLEPPRGSGLSSGTGLWERHCKGWYERFGLSITGFVIDGYAPPMPVAVLDAYSRFSPDGTVAQKVPPLSFHKGMPLLRMGDDLDHDPAKAAATIISRLDGRPPTFHQFRAVIKPPSWYADVVARVNAARPDVEFQDPYTFFGLVRKAGAQGSSPVAAR